MSDKGSEKVIQRLKKGLEAACAQGADAAKLGYHETESIGSEFVAGRLKSSDSQQNATFAIEVLAGGRRVAERAKSLLPAYDVFDENRYFQAAEARLPAAMSEDGPSLGLTVCEDTWSSEIPYGVDPVGELAAAGADVVLNLSASPFHVGKAAQRRRMIAALAQRHGKKMSQYMVFDEPVLLSLDDEAYLIEP